MFRTKKLSLKTPLPSTPARGPSPAGAAFTRLNVFFHHIRARVAGPLDRVGRILAPPFIRRFTPSTLRKSLALNPLHSCSNWKKR